MVEERRGETAPHGESRKADAPGRSGAVPIETASACANCGTVLQGPWCHMCGQRARSLRAPFRELLHEAADVLLDLDNRFFRSLRELVFRPGALSEAWASGHRSAFTGPIRLYLLFSVLYFLVASWVEATSFGFINFDAGEEFDRRFAEALPRMMFVIVPLSAAVFRLAFRSTGRWYVEHLIFALHVHAGWYLLFTAEALVVALAPPEVTGDPLVLAITAVQLILRFGTLVYLYLAARRFYRMGRAATAGRVAAAMIGYSTLLAMAVGAYVGVTQAMAD